MTFAEANPRVTDLHILVRRNELALIQQYFAATDPAWDNSTVVNAYDEFGYTPLMYAMKKRRPNLDIVHILLSHGADVHQEMPKKGDWGSINVMALALS